MTRRPESPEQRRRRVAKERLNAVRAQIDANNAWASRQIIRFVGDGVVTYGRIDRLVDDEWSPLP